LAISQHHLLQLAKDPDASVAWIYGDAQLGANTGISRNWYELLVGISA
jgi:hypothetical protein